MNYSETLEWMFNKLPMYHRIGAAAYKADLNNTIQLLQLLDNPQNNFKSVHVAGTNGKGSVSHMLASVFQEAGYKTGLYTSPHLRDFRERIRIDGEMIPEENVTQFIETYKNKFETMELSFFEMTVGMAFDYFAKEKVDIAIVEVGMGGRLDSTNLITPELSVITNIDFDHMKFLGDTRAEIAYEKAGIIKPGIPVVIGETHPETAQVFIDKAKECNSPIYFADQIFDCDKIHIESAIVQKFDIWKNSELYMEALETPLMGNYQRKNLTTVMCALDLLCSKFDLSEGDIRDGIGKVIRNTHLMGRWQILCKDPLTVADTGHNVAGITEVVRQLAEMQYGKLHFVLGMVNDKDIDSVLQLLPRNADYYFCKANIPRGLDANILAEKAFEMGLRGQVFESVSHAYRSAVNNAHFGDLVFVGGSNFTVAEVV
ncbi:MAG: bifunctional folylpolyglutamate synthase/dihydrofolate synthase [Bacteroidales bacterium]|nr:bifunctional folylpolyglutamate synthase/dihydrofolate synthase [Bacteroidales bacterium]